MNAQARTIAAQPAGRKRKEVGRFFPKGDLRTLHPKALWGYVRTQPLSFWMLNIYVFFEYVRPQQIYRSMGTLPYAQVSLLGAVAFLFMEGRRLKKPLATDYALMAFTGIILLSSLTAVRPDASMDSMQLWINWLLLYFLLVNIVDTEKRYFVYFVAFLLYSFKMSQHGMRGWIERGFSFTSWGMSGAPGWFQNSGEFAIQMAIFIPLSLYFYLNHRHGWGWKMKLLVILMPISAAMSIMSSSSRGGMLAMAGVMAWLVLQSKKKVKGALIAAVAGGIILVALPQEFKDRFDTIGEDETSINRQNYWDFGKEIMRERPVLGIGYANWLTYYHARFGYGALPHNIYIEAGAELGYTGLVGFIALIGATLWVNRKTRRAARKLGRDGEWFAGTALGLDAAMVGFLIAGTFVTVLYYPFFWMNLAMTASLHHSVQHTLSQRRRAHLAELAARRTSPAALAGPGR